MKYKLVLFSNVMAETITKVLWFVLGVGGCFSGATIRWEHKPQ